MNIEQGSTFYRLHTDVGEQVVISKHLVWKLYFVQTKNSQTFGNAKN